MLKRKNEEDPSHSDISTNGTKRAALDVDVTTETNILNPSSDEISLPLQNSTDSMPTRSQQLQQEIRKIEDTRSNLEKNTYIHLRMLCYVKEAAVIVGKKGDVIKRIKQQTNVRINVSDNIAGINERVIHFMGRAEDVAKAFSLVAKLLSGESEEKQSTDLNSRQVNITLLVPHAMIGFVIGKRGMTLKDIERKSSAYLKASTDSLPFSTDRTLNITGLFDAIYISIFLIAMVILENERNVKTKIVFYQPGQLPLYQHPSAIQPINYSIVQSQSNLIQRYPNYQEQYIPMAPPSPIHIPTHATTTATLANNLTKFQFDPTAKLHIPSRPPQFTPMQQIPMINNPYSINDITDGKDPRKLHLTPLIRLGYTHHNKQELFVPEEFVGSIIGKSGKFIKYINQSSLCQMFVSDRDGTKVENHEGERLVTIVGHIPGREMALSLISKKIEDDVKSRDLKNKKLGEGNNFPSNGSGNSMDNKHESLNLTSCLNKDEDDLDQTELTRQFEEKIVY